MRKWVLALAVLGAGCGDDKKGVPVPPLQRPAVTSVLSSTPADAKPAETAKAPAPAAAPAPAHRPALPPGVTAKSAMSAVFACPEAGCTFTDARKGTCLKHDTVQMKEQWFVCEKDAAKEPVSGKCSKCGEDLARKLF